MIIFYNGGFLATPKATKEGLSKLVEAMHYAVGKWNKDGRPNSGDKED